MPILVGTCAVGTSPLKETCEEEILLTSFVSLSLILSPPSLSRGSRETPVCRRRRRVDHLRRARSSVLAEGEFLPSLLFSFRCLLGSI